MTLPAPTHQTISYLARRFAEVGIRPYARHGQNFLIDLNLQKLIVDSAGLTPDDVVLEVGTGTGALTALAAERAAAVVTVEIDERLYQLAREELLGMPNVVMVFRDALADKSHMAPEVIDAVSKALAAAEGRKLKLVANLPYSVATPVIANLLASPIVPAAMTVTIQKELGDRLMAAPGTKDYGALSIWVQSQCRVELVRSLPPSVFWPRPKVTSSVMQITLAPDLRGRITDLAFFHDFVRSLFTLRRKFLRGALVGSWKGRLDKAAIDRALASAELDPEGRAEQLDVPAVLRLSAAMQAEVAKVGEAE